MFSDQLHPKEWNQYLVRMMISMKKKPGGWLVLQQLFGIKFLACVAVVFVPFYSFSKVGEAIETLEGMRWKGGKKQLNWEGVGTEVFFPTPSLLLFFIALALLPLRTPKISQTSILRSPLARASNSGRSLDNAKQKFVRGPTWWPLRPNAEDFYIVAQKRDTQGWRLSLGTTLTKRKLRRLAVETSVWTERNYWTVPCERSVRANFSSSRKFVR